MVYILVQRWVWCKVPPRPLDAIFCIASARSCVRGRRSDMHHGVRGGDTVAYRTRFAQAGHVTDIHRDPRAFRARERRYSHPGSGRARSHAPPMRTCMHTSSLYMYMRALVWRSYAYACTCTAHQTYSVSVPALAAANAQARLRLRTSFPPLHPRFGRAPPAAASAASAPCAAPASAAASASGPVSAPGWSHRRAGGGLGERDGAMRRRASRGGVCTLTATAADATVVCGRVLAAAATATASAPDNRPSVAAAW